MLRDARIAKSAFSGRQRRHWNERGPRAERAHDEAEEILAAPDSQLLVLLDAGQLASSKTLILLEPSGATVHTLSAIAWLIRS